MVLPALHQVHLQPVHCDLVQEKVNKIPNQVVFIVCNHRQ